MTRTTAGNAIATMTICALMAAGCGGGGGGEEDSSNLCSNEWDAWATGGTGASVADPPPAGEARAGVMASAADVPHGVKDKAAVGDFMMRNGKVAFVIEQVGEPGTYSSDGYQPFGGGIVYADLVGTDGEPMGASNFGESFHGIALRLLDPGSTTEPGSVTVLADGSDGGDAIVRVVGEMKNMPLLDVGFGFFFESADGAEYAMDYVLGPDDEFLEIRFQIRNPINNYSYLSLVVLGSLQGDGLALFSQEGGFDQGAMNGKHDMFGHVGTDLSYGWIDAEDEGLSYALVEAGILVVQKGRSVQLEACTETELPVVKLVVGAGGAEELLAAARRSLGVAEPPVATFEVTEAGGGPVTGARVHVTRAADGAYATSILAGPDGEWTAGLEPGDYLATAVMDGHPPLVDQAFTVTATGATVPLAIPEAGTITCSVSDGDMNPVPAKLMLFPVDAPDPLPASFGEKTYPGGAALYVWDPNEAGAVTLPPGGYHVTASRGFEYGIAEDDVTVAAGTNTAIGLVVDHVVDSAGMLCGDFHLHSLWSPDCSDPRDEKVRAAACEGVEILPSTDHDWVADYQPDVVAAGLAAWVHGMSGEEISTYDYGHINIYPQTIVPGARDNGAPYWYYREAPVLFDLVHADPLDPILQINHPRSTGSMGGYFNAAGFDPVAGTVSHPDVWYTDFQSVEVWNGEDFRAREEDAVRDWFAMLDMGMRFSAMGNSDGHDYLGSEIGYPRSCMLVGHDDPSALTDAEVKAAIIAQKVLVNGGILVTAEGPAGEGPGEIADAPSGTADIHVVVQAPLWIAADRLRVFVDGDEVDTITLDSTTADPANPVVRYDATFVATTSDGGDGWIVFVAEGDANMGPVSNGDTPFGLTNPIYLDADGDGAITARMPMP